jgi:cytochrome c-type biogenesis protein CcmH
VSHSAHRPLDLPSWSGARAWTQRIRFAVPAALAALVLALVPAAGATPAAPRTSLPAIERQVMCVTCKIPLNVAESPQANRERAFIQSLIDEGQDEAQIKNALVGQYGTTVLGLPRAKGFDLTVYIVPALAVAGLLALLAFLLPRWRRAARQQASSAQPEQALSDGEAARLESDMAHFD